ncbi:DUF4145 domain-containing protein [Peribacillus frigoritolerans]|uniref:DUF4145 domain-containing protein n=1 Tax=Peribacillus frigoritolerans TaxID=450367 RepID=UPI002E20E760|nr:DUF4145 domain-containing protein [Peribacillus frigoritolerans]
MRAKNVNPSYYLDAFNCPRCGVLAPQEWFPIYKSSENGLTLTRQKSIGGPRVYSQVNSIGKLDWDLTLSICNHCSKYTVWENQLMIYPFETKLPDPHEDLFGDVKGIYEEAALVYKHSPRAAAALLRLGIETMIPQLEEYNIKKGKINNMIGELVKKDIPEHIQKGLDLIRIYGNEGIHPGEIDLNDNHETVEYLFELINYMTEELITKKRKLNEFYSKLPSGKLKGVVNRDKSKVEVKE